MTVHDWLAIRVKWNLDKSLNVVNEDGSWGRLISEHAHVWSAYV